MLIWVNSIVNKLCVNWFDLNIPHYTLPRANKNISLIFYYHHHYYSFYTIFLQTHVYKYIIYSIYFFLFFSLYYLLW